MKHTGVIGRNSRNNERLHDAHDKRAYQAREDYEEAVKDCQDAYKLNSDRYEMADLISIKDRKYNRIVRHYPELLNDKGEVEN